MIEMEQEAYDNRKANLQAKIGTIIGHRELFLDTAETYVKHFEKGFEKIDAFIAKNENASAKEVFKYLGYLEEYYTLIERQTQL